MNLDLFFLMCLVAVENCYALRIVWGLLALLVTIYLLSYIMLPGGYVALSSKVLIYFENSLGIPVFTDFLASVDSFIVILIWLYTRLLFVWINNRMKI